MFTHVDHLLLRVSNFDLCRKTYRTGLGLRELGCREGPVGSRVCLLAVGPSVLVLQEDLAICPSLDPETGQAMTSKFSQDWVSHIALHARDARSYYELARERGIPWKHPPSDQPIGHHLIRRRLLEFDDPDLLTIQVAEIIDDEGRSLEESTGGAERAECDEIDHIALRVADMAAKREFYLERLGMEETMRRATSWGEEADFMVGGTAVELGWSPNTRSPLQAGTVSGLAFATPNLDAACEALTSKGIGFTGPFDQSPLPGFRRRAILFRDPDGLPLEVVESMPGR